MSVDAPARLRRALNTSRAASLLVGERIKAVARLQRAVNFSKKVDLRARRSHRARRRFSSLDCAPSGDPQLPPIGSRSFACALVDDGGGALKCAKPKLFTITTRKQPRNDGPAAALACRPFPPERIMTRRRQKAAWRADTSGERAHFLFCRNQTTMWRRFRIVARVKSGCFCAYFRALFFAAAACFSLFVSSWSASVWRRTSGGERREPQISRLNASYVACFASRRLAH